MKYSYITSRNHRVKINLDFNSWLDAKLGVPYGTVLGPLLLNMVMNDVFYAIEASKVCSFADDDMTSRRTAKPNYFLIF